VQFDKVCESSTVSSVQAVGLDASSAASRTDVIIIAASAILLLTGLQWLALRPTEKEAVHNFSPLYSKTGKTYRLTSDDGPHPRLIGFEYAALLSAQWTPVECNLLIACTFQGMECSGVRNAVSSIGGVHQGSVCFPLWSGQNWSRPPQVCTGPHLPQSHGRRAGKLPRKSRALSR
jgi:hypothetical protein